MYMHTYIFDEEKYKRCFYQKMSINTPLFFQINFPCVSKHNKSSMKFLQYTKCITETNKKGEWVGPCHREHVPMLKTKITFFHFLIHALRIFCVLFYQEINELTFTCMLYSNWHLKSKKNGPLRWIQWAPISTS